MKHIKKYKIFEDKEDENDIIPEGFKYSWNDVYESLLYLTDIGFKINEKSKKRYLGDEKGIQIKSSEYIKNAKNAIYEIKLFKEKKTSKIRKYITIGGYPSRDIDYYLDSNVEECLNIYEEIASFCSRFDKAYHNLTIEDDGYSIWLVVSSDVTEDFISKNLDDQLNDKSRSILFNQIHNSFDRFSSNSKFYTKKFREEFFGRSLYEIKNGIYIKTFDWNSVTKGVYSTNSSNFDKSIESTLSGFNDIDRWSLGKYGYKAEFRELKEEDITRLKDGEIEFAKKYIGTKAIIVKFDYDKVFDIIKKELKND